jgi:hypothetical protein
MLPNKQKEPTVFGLQPARSCSLAIKKGFIVSKPGSRVTLPSTATLRATTDVVGGIAALSTMARHEKFFFAKTPSAEGLPPFWAETVFGQVFGRGGMSNFQNPKVPPTGGRVCRKHIQARLRCAEPCQFRPAVPATDAS